MRHVYVSTRDAGLRPAAPRSDTAPNPDDNRVRFTAWLLPSGKVPQVTNAECVNTGSAVIYFNLAKDAASTTADFDVHSGLDSGGMIRGGGACLVVVVLAGSSGVGAQEAAAGPITNPVPLGAKSIATGGRLFQKYCKACHNADATGDGPLAPKGCPSAEPHRRRLEIRRDRRRDLHEHPRRHRAAIRHEADEEPDDRHRNLGTW